MVDNEGHKARSFVPKRPIRAAIIVFVVLSVLVTIFAIATGKTRCHHIALGIAYSAFLSFVSIGATLAARRLGKVVLSCVVVVCLVSAVFCGVLTFFPQVLMKDLRHFVAFAYFALLVAVSSLIFITAAAVSGWVRFAWRESGQ